MYLAINFWYWVLGVWLVSYIAFQAYGYYSSGIWRARLNMAAFLGVIVHEFSHLIVTLLCRLPVQALEIRWRHPKTNWIAPNGAVGTGDFSHRSFIKGFMICFAPLLVSTFLIFGCMDILFTIETTWFIQAGAIFFIVSLVLGAAPSQKDLSNLAHSVANDPFLGLAQASCYGLSVYIGVRFVDFSSLTLPFEFMYYALYFLASIVVYFMIFFSVKWTTRGIRAIYRKLSSGDTVSSNKSLTRKRIKSKTDPRENEGEWW